ncbi:MAG: thioredoxin domain-containing protein [Firmicutes bacterium]|nr:thioredoxin domain-containing protein [Bacillota bacterium]
MLTNKQANRLIREKSPYLLQHAYNPVNWYPWGEEAFAKAKTEDKPIFLSIGYSTCHWCHVMERESFENQDVADVLNRIFVCIKVDREERPDVDKLCMTVCQALTGSGGWPLTVFLTPDRRPFFAGTYFPPRTTAGRLGLMELALRVEKLWQTERKELENTADSLLQNLRNMTAVSPGRLPGEEILQQAFARLEEQFDPQYGGFGGAPKFPAAHNLLFLLRYGQRSGKKEALSMVERTLTSMRNGGIYDHLGFGFHRYATDHRWLLPHFEKMLYDQALLAIAYLEAYQVTGKELYAVTAGEVFRYVLRELTSPEGGFYSAEDADSEGVEGKFYTWTAAEIEQILGQDDARIFNSVYNIRHEDNFRDEATQRETGLNILHRTKEPAELAGAFGLTTGELEQRLAEMREKLFQVQARRIRPHKDDKILTDWNGLMIAAMAFGGRVLYDMNLLTAARRAADFILVHLTKDGKLLKRYREQEASLPAHLDDYAFFVWGLLELYESTFNPGYLAEALRLNQVAIDLFHDPNNGAFFFSAQAADLPVRQRELYDGALPSGNSVAALNNLRLARLTGNPRLEEIAAGIARAFAAEICRLPQAYTFFLCALDFLLSPSLEIVIAGEPGAEDTERLLRTVSAIFLPNKALLLHPGDGDDSLEQLAPFTRGMQRKNGRATAYVCSNYTCREPVTDPQDLRRLLLSPS